MRHYANLLGIIGIMDEKQQLPDLPLNFSCDYECESCRQNTRCILYAFECLGRKLDPYGEHNEEDYEQLVKDIQTNLERTIELVKSSEKTGSSMQKPNTSSNRPRNDGPDKIPILYLSREFTDMAYKLLKTVRVKETIPLKLLISIRDLQYHHTLVTIKLCRAVAALTENSSRETRTITEAATEAKESLYRCKNALLDIVSLLPEKQELVAELLNLSAKIFSEIRIRFS